MTFAERGALLKAVADALQAHRDELLDLAVANGGNTRGDAKFDVDGAIFTLSAYAELGKSLGAARILADGEGISLGRSPRFHGQHVSVPRHGVAVHVNAFNFPAWGLAEKAACALLAGMPVVSKPATSSALVAHRIAADPRRRQDPSRGRASRCSVGERRATCSRTSGAQDVVAFTGSGATGARIRALPNVIEHSVRVNVEADSLNAAILGPDVAPGDETWDYFLKDVLRDMTQKAGQKCTAIRRVWCRRRRPSGCATTSSNGSAASSSATRRRKACAWGRLRRVRSATTYATASRRWRADGRLVFANDKPPQGVPDGKGYFVGPVLIELEQGAAGATVHGREVFGPVATVVPYSGAAADAAELVARGRGGLVSSVYSEDTAFVADAVAGLAPYTAGCSSAAPASPSSRPDPARCCRSSSTADRAAPAAARSWAAFEGSRSIASAWPSKVRVRLSTGS